MRLEIKGTVSNENRNIEFDINDKNLDINIIMRMQDLINQNVETGAVIIEGDIFYCLTKEQGEALEKMESIYDKIWDPGEFEYRYTEYAYSLVLRDSCVNLEDEEKIYYARKNNQYPYFVVSKHEEKVREWLDKEIDALVQSNVSETDAAKLYEYNFDYIRKRGV